MSIEDLLKSKIIENPIERYTRELEAVESSGLITKLLSRNKLKKEVAELGLLIAKLKHNYHGNFITLGSKEATAFEKLIKPAIWDDKNYYDLLPEKNTVETNELQINTFQLNHPGGCLGYSIRQSDGGLLVITTDFEPDKGKYDACRLKANNSQGAP